MAAPGFDPELRASLAVVGGVFPPTVTPDLVDHMREVYASPPVDGVLAELGIEREDVVVPGYRGERIGASVLRARRTRSVRPGIVYLHSGGMMFGDRFSGMDQAFRWVQRYDAVLVTAEYRLAPEYPDPYPREDCYATLVWVAEHAERLGIRADRLMVAGASSGGGLAAGVALAARDRGGPPMHGQLLDYPMLDDRGLTESTGQFDGVGVWDRVSNETGWSALLGARRGTEDVSAYAAPARASDLTGLPPAFLTVGEAEIFRDETVAYAAALWRSGVSAQLHVVPGGFHALDIFAPHTAAARTMISARDDWLERMLAD